jgi:N-acetyl-anhydromuramyl-L-alanine amidase AmpD
MSDGFPGAIWIPAHTDRFVRKDSRVIEEIVLHVTEGIADKAEVTARNAFGVPKYLPNRRRTTSSGRNGTVVQCVHHKDMANYAGTANEWTIDVEHNARSGKDTTLSAAQYLKSAELVVWLCKQVGLAPNRYNISGHSEVDPGTTHSSCPGRVLDWDLYMSAISDVQEMAQGRTPMRLWNDDEI